MMNGRVVETVIRHEANCYARRPRLLLVPRENLGKRNNFSFFFFFPGDNEYPFCDLSGDGRGSYALSFYELARFTRIKYRGF